MPKIIQFMLLTCILCALILPGCTSTPASPATLSPTLTARPSATPNLCLPGNIQIEAQKVHAIMRAFDDTNFVANLTPQQELGDLILQLEQYRRNTEDLVVPACLFTLKQAAVSYMNSVIGYLGYFMSGGDSDIIGELITISQQIRKAYNSELNLALTFGTPTVNAPTASITPTPYAIVTNDTQQGFNLRQAPAGDAYVVQILMPGATASVLGRNEAGDWLLVEYNGAQLWLNTSVATFNFTVRDLPVMTPTFTPTP